MLFNEPKLLKFGDFLRGTGYSEGFSALQRAEIAEIERFCQATTPASTVSVLFNEPKLLKFAYILYHTPHRLSVSVLFNEPKLLKCKTSLPPTKPPCCFSALQRAEIAEMAVLVLLVTRIERVSVLFNEPKLLKCWVNDVAPVQSGVGFSALQRAEIAEMMGVLTRARLLRCFSALQRAEIAEICMVTK